MTNPQINPQQAWLGFDAGQRDVCRNEMIRVIFRNTGTSVSVERLTNLVLGSELKIKIVKLDQLDHSINLAYLWVRIAYLGTSAQQRLTGIS